ncbi:MAG TPA: polyribonucleotide nucleotidyltransferase [Actinomycetota bacterium]|nr:polyribonucleotide nucleotidyltransferase [Actinomycetota bacterium]
MDTPFILEREIEGKTYKFEAGKLARLADGAVIVGVDETQILVTAVASSKPKDQLDFFPLTVDVEERMYAVGKIPGSFFRREGRPSETAILTARLIDRPLRPSFPKGFRNEIHVIATILSADQVNQPDVLSITGASMAVILGGMPFEGPLAGVRLGYKGGTWITNPTFQEIDECTFDMVVAGGLNDAGDVDIIMVEAEATVGAWNLIMAGHPAPTEDVVADGLEFAKGPIREFCEMQQEFAKLAAKAVREFPTFPEYGDDVMSRVEELAKSQMSEALQIADKAARELRLDEIKDEVKTSLAAIEELAERDKEFSPSIRSLTKRLIRQRIITEGLRIDGRKADEIRPLSAEVTLLPRAHGTGLFQRGETQVLSIATLGMMRMEQMIDTIDPEESKRYMHHYNFPPFSTGETGFMRGPKRREIGHGALAERALLPVVPPEDEFPYALRVVSEVLSSNGSTSMASVCGSTLSLMDAGVPIYDMVAGIAMGLIHEGGEYVTLTDILGAEDAYGDMDFKVAGTKEFVTALQLDTKLTGIPSDVLAQALEQAKRARMQVLDVMKGAISEPRDELSPLAPHIITVQIPVDKIGEVIGPKGKKIKEIQEETGAEIDIQDDGRIFIASTGGDGAERAKEMINEIANPIMPEIGTRYMGKVAGLTDFGAFVSIPGGKDGLLHVSKLGLGKKRIGHPSEVLEMGQQVEVQVMRIDERAGKISLAPIDPETNEAYEPPERPREDRGDRGDRGRGGRDRDRGRGGRDRDRGGRDRDRGPRADDAPQSAPPSDEPAE